MDLQLRDTVETDGDVLFAQQDDPVANEMAVFPARDRGAFDDHLRAVLSNPECLAFTILVDEAIVGSIGSWFDDDHREVGYWIGREYWGKGIATGALRAFLDIERTRPLVAFVAVGNIASRRVAERCGFAFTREKESEGVRYSVYELPSG